MNLSDQVRPVSMESEEERVVFVQRTYLHLGFAILSFMVIEFTLLQTAFAGWFLNFALSEGINWLIVLGLFIVVGYIADNWARSGSSPAVQYLGLGLYVLAEAILFLPLLFIAAHFSSPAVIPSAAIVTLSVFGGLTALVFLVRVDFSFLGMALQTIALLLFGLIVASLLIGFDLGVGFAVVMVGLAAGYILYTTSNILHHYRKDQYVAAALALFASFALMFWYILQLFMMADDDD